MGRMTVNWRLGGLPSFNATSLMSCLIGIFLVALLIGTSTLVSPCDDDDDGMGDERVRTM
jgi:hypothetical protein